MEVYLRNSLNTKIQMKNILLILIFGFSTLNAQTVVWSKLFDFHSINSLGGLSKNAIKDSNNNIIVAVVEYDTLKIYKLDNLGNVITTLNTNNECGYFTQIEEVSANNYALVYNNTPTAIHPTFKLIQFNNTLNTFQETTLNFTINNPISISSFFIKNDIFYFSVLSDSAQGLYSINDNNQLILNHLSTIPNIVDEKFSFLQNGNYIIDYSSANNHLVRCISPISGQLVWDKYFINNDTNTYQLEYKTTIDLNDNIYFAGLERTWVDSQQNDVIKLRKLDESFGDVLQSNFLIPLNQCLQKIDDFKFNPSNNHLYISYRSCFPNPAVVLVELDNAFNLVNQISFPFVDDSLESGQGSSILIRDNGKLIFTYSKYKDGIENGNLFIYNLNSNLTTNGSVDLNIQPKNSSEAFSDFNFYDNSKLLITGLVPNTNPLIWLEEVQHYVAMIDVDAILSVENPNSDNNIIFYPNPTTGTFNIITGNETIDTITIFSLTGEKVKEVQGVSTTNISDLSSGIYFLKIKTTSAKTFFKKVVKN